VFSGMFMMLFSNRVSSPHLCFSLSILVCRFEIGLCLGLVVVLRSFNICFATVALMLSAAIAGENASAPST